MFLIHSKPGRGAGRLLIGASLLFCGAALTIGAESGAEDRADVYRLRAEGLARAGQCEEAAPLFDRVRTADPSDGRPAYFLGQCAIRSRDYVGAAELLDEARSLDPSLEDVNLYLAIARFHMDDFVGARSALAQAEKAGADSPEYHLYNGLLLLQQAEARKATAAFERARRADPSMGPVANYYEGLAQLSMKEKKQARKSLERVEKEAPGTIWAEQASRVLKRYQPTPPGEWLTMSIGGAYDSNVLLRADGVAVPQELSGQQDIRGELRLDGGVELAKDESGSIGVVASYLGTLYDDLTDFDVNYPTVGFWFDKPFSDETVFRFQYDFGYAWVGGESYQMVNRVIPSVFQDWHEAGSTQFFVAPVDFEKFYFDTFDVPSANDFVPPGCPSNIVCGPPGIDEAAERDRDGYRVTPGAEHSFPFSQGKHILRAGYWYHYRATEGSEFSYNGQELRLGIRSSLPWNFVFDLGGRFMYRGYRHSSTYPDPDDLQLGTTYTLSDDDRRETEWNVEAKLEHYFNEMFAMSLEYLYTNNDSNVQIYNYERDIIGIYATARFR